MTFYDTPKSVDLAITGSCNQRCKYCSHFNSPGETKNDLPTDQWLKFFEELKNCLVMNVFLQGGEPFYREELDKILLGIIKNKMRFAILSNGTLITDKWARFLKDTERCDYVQVSIDSSIPSHHDAARGQGSFTKAINGIKLLQKYKIQVLCRVTISKYNVYDLEDLTEFLLKDIGLKHFGVSSASYLGLCMKNQEEIGLSAKERSIAMESLLKLNKKYNNRITATAGPLAEAQIWQKMIEARKQGLDNLSRGGYLTSCNANISKIAVKADGTLVPCIQMGHIELGKINQDSLYDIWHNSTKLNSFRNRDKIPLSNINFCQDCDFINYCQGGCPATAQTYCQSDFVPDPDICLKRFLKAGGKFPDQSLYE
ncbi:MAG: SynChlorMet cassette radical SAM/SPASM protein ScmE [Candidatus Saganbacteria bacterium]|nr:SynChlorMet cassette radical SAM/SPASM protein ScmE [Candidatus Saganbacteria bacterium]